MLPPAPQRATSPVFLATATVRRWHDARSALGLGAWLTLFFFVLVLGACSNEAGDPTAAGVREPVEDLTGDERNHESGAGASDLLAEGVGDGNGADPQPVPPVDEPIMEPVVEPVLEPIWEPYPDEATGDELAPEPNVVTRPDAGSGSAAGGKKKGGNSGAKGPTAGGISEPAVKPRPTRPPNNRSDQLGNDLDDGPGNGQGDAAADGPTDDKGAGDGPVHRDDAGDGPGLSDQLDPADIAFNRPERMRYKRPTAIEVVLANDAADIDVVATLGPNLRGTRELRTEVESARHMTATLKGAAFEVSPDSPQERTVLPDRATRWTWDVTPMEHGEDLVLTLELFAILKTDDGALPPVSVGVFREAIPVDVAGWDQFMTVLTETDRLLKLLVSIGGAVAAIAGWAVWRRRKKAN